LSLQTDSGISGEAERALASVDLERTLRTRFKLLLFLVIVLSVWISTKPFTNLSPDFDPNAGDLVNQLTFSGLALAAGLALLMTPFQAMRPLLQPSYVLVLMALGISIFFAGNPSGAFRSCAFTLIVMFLAAALYAIPERFRQFQSLLLLASAAVMGLSYIGIIILPDLAMHTDFDPFEPEHAGSWKGHFDHKNIAGAMMGALAVVGIYAIRTGRPWLGWAMLIGGFVFLYFTKSKTSLGLLPMAIVVGYMVERIPWLVIRLGLCLGPIAALLVLTLGSALWPEVADFNKLIMKDATFTGRFDIWRYGFEMLAYRPWTGYGYEGFWQTPVTLEGESKLELAWAAEKIVHGHNSYLDVALTMGIPGMVIVGYAFIIKPVIDYHWCQPTRDNRLYATMCLTIWLYIALGMCLESYFFRRADPVWFAFLIAVFGLRFTATFPFDSLPSQDDQASSATA
jgi:O-antigen ligase